MDAVFDEHDCDLIVIMTDSYAGNFERDMTAFITGKVGDCCVGEDLIQKDFDYSMFEKSVKHIPDEYGTKRPSTIYPNDNYVALFGIEFKPEDNDKKLNAIQKCKDYFIGDAKKKYDYINEAITDYQNNGDSGIAYQKFIEKQYKKISIEEMESHKKIYQKIIDEYTNKDENEFETSDAFLSVAISFHKNTITPEIIDITKERATLYCKDFSSRNINIEGFKKVKVRTKLKEIVI